MSSIQIVTDSTGYIPKDFILEHNIKVVPLSVHFDDEVENEGFPGEFQEFYDRLKIAKNFPFTSQPSTYAFTSVFEKAINEGKEIIVLTISSKLSGTFNNALIAAEMVSTDKISIIDSETTAANLRFLVEEAVELVDMGKNRDEIIKIIEAQKKNMGISVTVDTLDYLKKGGRLSVTQAFLGTMLNIFPVIALVDGSLIPVGKTRGKNKAIQKMVSRLPETVVEISICHISNTDEAHELKETLQAKFPGVPISIDEIGPVIGAHLGPKAIGICFKW